MKFIQNVQLHDASTMTRKYLVALLLITMTACTRQQYYEGLKAGRSASCLEYPESEYEDCIDETKTSFEEYKRQREQVIGN
jgi:hypothetical protein